MNDASLDDTLKSVFSLLPPTKADEARKALLKQLNTVGPANAEDIAWAEFTTDGRFIRGGFSSPADKSTQLVSNSQESLEIATLGQMISNGEAGAGTAL